MQLSQIDPFVRFAAGVRDGIMNTAVKVTDCRIFYVEEGQAQIFIGQERCQLRKNSLFYCCGGSTYRVQSQSGLKLVCINFDLNRSHRQETLPLPVYARAEHWAEIPVYFEPVEDSSFLNGHLFIEDASWLYESVLELVREQGQGLSSLLCGSLLKTLLLRLHRAKQQQMPPKLALVQDYIRSNYHRELTNEQLGTLAGYHPYYLNRLFYGYTGMKLHQFLVKVRMEQASYLIINTQLPLTAVAEQVGIRSYPHFSSCFKSYYGCSPAQYRSRNGAGI